MKKMIDKKTAILEPKQGIYSILYGGRFGYITKIEGEQTPNTIKTLFDGVGVMGGSANIYIRFENGNETNVPESIVRGVQWEIYEVLTDQQIQEIDQKYFKAIEERKIKEEQKRLKDIEETKQLINKYSSYLIQKKNHAKGEFDCVKQNIRIELKKEFPSIKFSVSSNHYGSVNIRWTDGPTIDQVQKFTSKYEDHETDFTGDFRDYNPSNFNDLFGGCNYVFEHRDQSENTNKMLLNWAQDLFDSKLHSDNFGCYSIGNLAHKLFYQYPVYNNPKVEKINTNGGLNAPETFYKITSDMPLNKTENNTNTNKTNKSKVNKELNNNSDQSIINNIKDLNFIDYSDRSFVITGNTYPIKETLKQLNGKFNRFLTCGAGWVFSKTRIDEVKEKLSLI